MLRRNSGKMGGWQESMRLKAREKELGIGKADLKRREDEMIKRGPGYEAISQNKHERDAGITPPGFEGVRDVKTGQLLDQYKSDPFRGEASQRMRAEAFGTGPSEWAKAALGRQGFEEGELRDRTGLQAQSAQSAAQSQLMRQGGLGGGARTSLARSGARDALMAQQQAAASGIQSRFGINETDTKRRQDLMGSTADLERGADTANIGTMKSQIEAKAQFDSNRYNKQMEVYAAEKSAAATRAASGGGGKCFAESTEVFMKDKTKKKISEIKVGEIVFGGGEVLEVRSYADQKGFELYNYNGTMLTGSHAVFEDGKWVRVKDAVLSEKTDLLVEVVHTLVTKNHSIICNNEVFSDDVETDEDLQDESESLDALNNCIANGAI